MVKKEREKKIYDGYWKIIMGLSLFSSLVSFSF